MVSVEGLSRLHYFTEMRGDELASIAPHFEERSVEDGAVIYRAGESADFLYGISHGDVELDMPLFHGGEGEKSLVRLQDGSIFGIGEIFFQNYYLTAHARSRTLLYAVPRMVFLQTILPLPAVNKKVLEDFAFMTKVNTLIPSWNTARERLLLYISTLVNNQPRGGTTLLPASITVTRLSEVLGLTREHCSRIVASLVHEGVLEKDGRQIAVNRDALEAEPAIKDFLGKIKF